MHMSAGGCHYQFNGTRIPKFGVWWQGAIVLRTAPSCTAQLWGSLGAEGQVSVTAPGLQPQLWCYSSCQGNSVRWQLRQSWGWLVQRGIPAHGSWFFPKGLWLRGPCWIHPTFQGEPYQRFCGHLFFSTKQSLCLLSPWLLSPVTNLCIRVVLPVGKDLIKHCPVSFLGVLWSAFSPSHSLVLDTVSWGGYPHLLGHLPCWDCSIGHHASRLWWFNSPVLPRYRCSLSKRKDMGNIMFTFLSSQRRWTLSLPGVSATVPRKAYMADVEPNALGCGCTLAVDLCLVHDSRPGSTQRSKAFHEWATDIILWIFMSLFVLWFQCKLPFLSQRTGILGLSAWGWADMPVSWASEEKKWLGLKTPTTDWMECCRS